MKFNNSGLDLVEARSIKAQKLNQCTEIEDSANFVNLLENMNSDS